MATVSLTVTAQGWQWSSNKWVTRISPVIGTTAYMTGFSFTPSQRLSSYTISFITKTSGSTSTVAARYGTTKPTTKSAAGTSISLTHNPSKPHSITITGDFPANTTQTLWVWGVSSWQANVSDVSGTGVANTTPASIYLTSEGWTDFTPTVYYNGSWYEVNFSIYNSGWS